FVSPSVTFSVPAPAPQATSAHATDYGDRPAIAIHEEQIAAAESEPTTIYEVCEIHAGAPILLEVSASFDAAADAAFDLIEERDPSKLEIVIVRGDEREVTWSYTKDATTDRPRGSLDLFGFDATRWTGVRR